GDPRNQKGKNRRPRWRDQGEAFATRAIRHHGAQARATQPQHGNFPHACQSLLASLADIWMLNSCFLGSVARTDAEYVNHKTNWTATDKRVVGRTLSFFQPVFETG